MREDMIWIVRKDELKGGYNAVAGNESRRFESFSEAVEWLESTRGDDSCPFCGKEKLTTIEERRVGACMFCTECGARGPLAKSDVEAYTLWVKRRRRNV